MSPRPAPPDLDDLLSHARWLQGLARLLVQQGPLADDLVQDAWVATLGSPPDSGRPARPWLAQVLRNLVRMHVRGETRRHTREALADPGEPLPAADVLLERMELQRLVAKRVMTLDEPFRSTLLLCFYEGHAPSEIARRSGIPAGTVRWRLKEAIDRLRRELDGEHGGDRQSWRAALLPLAWPPGSGGPGPRLAGEPGSITWAATAALGVGVITFGLAGPDLAGVRGWLPARTSAQPATSGAKTEPGPAPAAGVPGRAETLRREGRALGVLLPALLSASSAAARQVSRDQAIDACVDRRERVLACPGEFADAFAASSPLLGKLRQDSLRAMALREMAQDGAGPLDDRRGRCARDVDARRRPSEGDLDQLRQCFALDDCAARVACAMPLFHQLKQPR